MSVVEVDEVRAMSTSAIVTALIVATLDPQGSRGIVPGAVALRAELDARVPRTGTDFGPRGDGTEFPGEGRAMQTIDNDLGHAEVPGQRMPRDDHPGRAAG